jgi:predicted PurR-regulated permease PerM
MGNADGVHKHAAGHWRDRRLGTGVIYLIAIGPWERATVLGVFSAVVFSGIDHILRPRLIASRIGLNQLAMFFAPLGGVHVFGILGIVLGPVMFATADAIIQILREPQPTPAAEPATL